tara:strand:- start:2079 stop:2348 length:270 start_codon:yes stop_codon:yes gene_type:complete
MNTVQSKERLELLADKYKAIQTALRSPFSGDVLKPKQKRLFLQGFALASFRDDIIFQVAWSFGRCPLAELELFLDQHVSELEDFEIDYK